jgi:hypothetical protein
MPMFRSLARAFVLQRLMQRGQRRRHGRYGRSGRRGRTGFWGPMPYYSGRTRRGTRVHVSGCCLPIPLGMLLATVLGARSLVRRG